MAKRRSHNEGSIYQRKDGMWVGQVTLPTGKRKYKYAKTQKEARAWVDGQRRLLHDGLLPTDEKTTVKEFMGRWFDEVCRHQLRASTLSTNKSVINRHIYPTIGEIKLAQLSPAHLQALYSQKLNEGLSKRTVKYIHTLIHRMLDQALKSGMVSKNVAKAVDSPTPDKHEVEPLTQARKDHHRGHHRCQDGRNRSGSHNRTNSGDGGLYGFPNGLPVDLFPGGGEERGAFVGDDPTLDFKILFQGHSPLDSLFRNFSGRFCQRLIPPPVFKNRLGGNFTNPDNPHPPPLIVGVLQELLGLNGQGELNLCLHLLPPLSLTTCFGC